MPDLTWPSKATPEPIQAALELDSLVYPQGAGYPHVEPENQLILGDNLAVMSALLPQYAGQIQLIYADPPFFTNRRYPARIGRGEDSRRPKEWQLADGYPDSWRDIDAYLDMLYPRLALMHHLLAPAGTLYLHLDWHANAYARLLLDEIFGPERLLNEIIWLYHGPSPIRSAFNRKHDTLLVYTKGPDYTFNADAVRQPYDLSTVKTFASSPKAGFGKIPDLERGKVPEDWWYFPVVARLHNERTGYPTQKPEALLERILLASSNPGDLIADFFCGAGTAPCVAARLGRRFIATDVAWRAVHTTRSRLVELPSGPFSLSRVRPAGQASPAEAPMQDSAAAPLLYDPSNRRLSLPQTLLASLDYWEVDPAWDGRVFRSAQQVTRPRKKGPIPGELHLAAAQGEPLLAVRSVSIHGQQSQAVVKTNLAKP